MSQNTPTQSKTSEPFRLALVLKPISLSVKSEAIPHLIENQQEIETKLRDEDPQQRSSHLINIGLIRSQTINNNSAHRETQPCKNEGNVHPSSLSINELQIIAPDDQQQNTTILSQSKMVYKQYDDMSDTSSKLDDEKIIHLKELENLLNRIFKNENIEIADLDLNYAELHILVEVLMRKNRKFNFK